MSLPEGFQDAIYHKVRFSFSLLDRIKLLFGWELNYIGQTLCENPAGKTAPGDSSSVTLSRPLRIRHYRLGSAETQPAESEQKALITRARPM